MTVQQDLEFHKGENWIVQYECNDGVGNDINLTGAELEWALATLDSTLVMTRTIGDGITLTSPLEGSCTLSVTPAHQMYGRDYPGHHLSLGASGHHCGRHHLGPGRGQARRSSLIVELNMAIKSVTIPVTQDQPQPVKASLQILGGRS